MGFKVLIVEDSKVSRDRIAEAVQAFSEVQAIVAENGFDALKLLPLHRFDLIITDIRMPDINGLELINFVKKNPNYRRTPLLVVSNEASAQDTERSKALGAQESLLAPIEAEAVQGLIRRYLNVA